MNRTQLRCRYIPLRPTQSVRRRVRSSTSSTARTPTCWCCFASPHFVGAFDDVASTLRNLLDPKVLIGRTAVVDHRRQSRGRGRTGALRLRAPECPASSSPRSFCESRTPPTVTRSSAGPTRQATARQPDALRRPVHVPGRRLPRSSQRRPPRPSGDRRHGVGGAWPGGNRLVVDDTLWTEGAVGVLVEGGLAVDTVVSQGCRPIGQPFIVTRAERNLVHELGGQPALDRLQELAAAASDDERGSAAPGPAPRPRRRRAPAPNSAAATSSSATCSAPTARPGAIAVGDEVEVGQTVQFHVRDAGARRRGPPRAARPAPHGRRRAALHVQRPRAASCSGVARPRRRAGRGAARADPAGRRVLRRRDRARRRAQLPARLHRELRALPGDVRPGVAGLPAS